VQARGKPEHQACRICCDLPTHPAACAVCALLPCCQTNPPQTAVVSLGNTKQPLPGFTSRSSLLPSRHGQLSDNIALVAAMPAVSG
jgi:hypothetical protein